MFACISSPTPTPQLAPSPPNKWSFWHNRNSFPCGLGSLFIRGVATITEPVWPGSILTPSPTRLFGRWIFFCASWKFWRKTEIQLRNIIIKLHSNCLWIVTILRNYTGDTFRAGNSTFNWRSFRFPRIFAFLRKLELQVLRKLSARECWRPRMCKSLETQFEICRSHMEVYFFCNIFKCHIDINIFPPVKVFSAENVAIPAVKKGVTS